MSRHVKVIGALIAAAVVAVAAAVVVVPRLMHRPMTITALFEDTVGLYAGNAVSVLGMGVGTVTSVVPKDSYVEVKLAIDHGIDIPADVQAVTVSNSILTDRVVELTPPYRGGEKLKDGAVLGPPGVRTHTPVEFDKTLRMVDKLGKALHGDDQGHGPLGNLINLSADITSANGPQIRATLDKLSQALRVGSDKGAHSKKNIQAIISSVSELTQAAADNDATIREFGSNLRQLSDILAAEDLGSGSTGAKANQLLAEAARLLEGHREGLQGTLANTQGLMTTLTDNQREIAELLDVAPMTIDNMYNMIDPVGGSFRGHLLLNKIVMNSMFTKEVCNLMGLKQLGCATGTLRDYAPDFGLGTILNLMDDGISGTP
ncbi:MCE family protein [Mycobacterium sp. pUA109]|uniref:MCE family protein n=1 Tax=Mycobacterium sp. pUA109 TaxID=3238982 RepID=UPI00351BDCF7